MTRLEEWPSSTEFGLQACLPLCPPVPQGVGGHHFLIAELGNREIV
jgi:hypothetical protein